MQYLSNRRTSTKGGAEMSNIDIIDDLISGLFDDCEQEQEHAQKIINAWITIKKELNK